MNQNLKQNCLYLLIILILGSIFITIKPSPAYTPHGILLPLNPAEQISNEKDIQVLDYLPADFQKIGYIRVNKHFESKTKEATERNYQENLAYAKKLAAEAGANAIIIQYAAASEKQGPLDAFVLYAFAIHTEQVKK